MTTSPASPVPSKSPLDAAQKIVAELQGMRQEDQVLAIRFATQTLRIESSLPQDPIKQQQQSLTEPATIAASSPGSSIDIKSFTAEKSPNSDQQFTAVVAYYYQFESPEDVRKIEIDADTMQDAARQAGRPQVARWNMTLTNAKNAGYLDQTGPGKFKLNAVGENLVAITLPNSAGSGSAASSGRKSKKKTAKKKPTKKKVSKKGKAKKTARKKKA